MTLLNIIGKVLSKVLIRRLEPILDRRLSQCQFGFRRRFSTTHAILCFRLLREITLDAEVHIPCIFIDVERGFDSAPHLFISDCLTAAGSPTAIVHLIEGLHSDFEASVAGSSVPIPIQRGTRQGSVEGPALWNLCYDSILRKLEDVHGFGVDLLITRIADGIDTRAVGGQVKLQYLAFADDLMAIGADSEALTELLSKFVEVGEPLGIRINSSKSRVMWLGGKPETAGQVLFKGVPVEEVTMFSYLGAAVENQALLSQ